MDENRNFVMEICHETKLPGCYYLQEYGWHGRAYKIPREKMTEACDKVTRFQNPGVYILIGEEVIGEKQLIYVGEGGKVRDRLLYHLQKKLFWKEAIVFVSDNDEQLYHKWLEYKFIQILSNSTRCEFDNGQIPNPVHLEKKLTYRMNDFITMAQRATLFLGHRIFMSIELTKSKDDDLLTVDNNKLVPHDKEKPIFNRKIHEKPLTVHPALYGRVFYENRREGANGRGEFLEPLPGESIDRFKVYKGSTPAITPIPSLDKRRTNDFNKLIDLGIITKNSEGLLSFSKDYIFNNANDAIETISRGGPCAGFCWKEEGTDKRASEVVFETNNDSDNKLSEESVIKETKKRRTLKVHPILYGRIFYDTFHKDCNAKGEFLDPLPGKPKDRFKVYKNSILATEAVPSFPQAKSSYNKFNELVESGIIVENYDKRLVFTEDYIFNNSTVAIEVIRRSKCPGWVWVDEETNKIALDVVNEFNNSIKLFYCKGRGGNATGIPSLKGFIVFKGSIIAPEAAPSIKDWIEKIENTLLKDGTVVLNSNGELEFTRDHLFNSPSGASCLILKISSNGRTDWKDETGKTLKEHQETQTGE